MALVSLIVAVAFFVAACGGAASPAGEAASGSGSPNPEPGSSVGAAASADPSSEDGAPGTKLTACEVVTVADIEAATGTRAEPGDLLEKPNALSPNYSECTYSGEYGQVVVQLDPNIGDRVFPAAKDAATDAKDIAGIGDGAFWTEQYASLYAVKGKVNVLLRMGVGNDNEAVATALATQAMNRL